MKKSRNTSWEPVSKWYKNLTQSKGHYYHREVIFPNLLKHFNAKKQGQSILDLGCGNGVLLEILPENFEYLGLDVSKSLIKDAQNKYPKKRFKQQDLSEDCHLKESNFSHAIFLLSFQNLEKPSLALKNAKNHLRQGGTLILLINHPCFRIPRQSDWGFDEKQNSRYRKIYRYQTQLEIPIKSHPSRQDSEVTFTYHHSLQEISKMLFENGFVIASIKELSSNKKSVGTKAKPENFSRKEIPLFMTIIAKSL